MGRASATWRREVTSIILAAIAARSPRHIITTTPHGESVSNHLIICEADLESHSSYCEGHHASHRCPYNGINHLLHNREILMRNAVDVNFDSPQPRDGRENILR